MESNFIDKIGLADKLKSETNLVLEFGAGQKKKPGRLNVDILNLPETDLVADLEQGLPFLPDNSASAIYASSFLEHIDNLDFLMSEIHRVLKPDGLFFAFVPHFSNPYFYSDPTHKRFFGLYTFSYFSKSHYPFRRKVPKFYYACDFRIVDIKLIFTSRWLTKFFNSRHRLKEIYERRLSRLFSCYGLEVKLKAVK